MQALQRLQEVEIGFGLVLEVGGRDEVGVEFGVWGY